MAQDVIEHVAQFFGHLSIDLNSELMWLKTDGHIP